jgi:hypothetical protein
LDAYCFLLSQFKIRLFGWLLANEIA